MQARTQRCHISTKLLPTLQLWFLLFLFFWSFIIILMANQVKKNVWSDKNQSHGAHSEYLRINELARTVGMINSTFISLTTGWRPTTWQQIFLHCDVHVFQSHQFDKKNKYWQKSTTLRQQLQTTVAELCALSWWRAGIRHADAILGGNECDTPVPEESRDTPWLHT